MHDAQAGTAQPEGEPAIRADDFGTDMIRLANVPIGLAVCIDQELVFFEGAGFFTCHAGNCFNPVHWPLL